MSEEYSTIFIRNSMQGKQLPDSIKKEIKNYFNKDSMSDNECKDRLASLLGGKNKTSRENIYKNIGFDYDEKNRVEDIIINNK